MVLTKEKLQIYKVCNIKDLKKLQKAMNVLNIRLLL